MYNQINFNDPQRVPRRSGRLRLIFFSIVLLAAGLGALYLANSVAENEISVGNESSAHATLWNTITHAFPFAKSIADDPEYALPKAESNRTDILILGIRGKDDPDGGLLSDTIVLLSYDKTTNRASLVSIPRDLFVRIDSERRDKLNAVYERLGLRGTRLLVSRITGVYVDNIVIFDFNAFKSVVDALGGVDVTLDRPFEETTQWGYVFSLPKGPNHLDGQNALYYVRSRYSSSDFDRARRQQQVIFAIKSKLMALNVLEDPGKALALVSSIKNHVVTDFDIFDIDTMLSLAKNLSPATVERHVITTENLVYESHINGAYVLLPKGDTFEGVKKFFREVLL